MFPLGNPLLPFSGIPLHVFEDRYRRLMADVLDGDRTFGVVMIERGSEVGGGELRSDIGTVARIAEAEELDDGRWLLIAVGVQRLRVVEWLPDDPYPRALVEVLPHREPGVPEATATTLGARVRTIAGLLTELGESAPPIDIDLADDPLAAAYQAMAVIGLGPLDTQRILELDDDGARVDAVLEQLRDAEDLLNLRIAHG